MQRLFVELGLLCRDSARRYSAACWSGEVSAAGAKAGVALGSFVSASYAFECAPPERRVTAFCGEAMTIVPAFAGIGIIVTPLLPLVVPAVAAAYVLRRSG